MVYWFLFLGVLLFSIDFNVYPLLLFYRVYAAIEIYCSAYEAKWSVYIAIWQSFSIQIVAGN
jgi:hypothetical protein